MIRYNEIVGLNKYFMPYFDITKERGDYWKSFIPNEKFYDLLRGILFSLEGNNPQDKKSLWVQGTYGTGKSHATGVIKHLLFDKNEEIFEFINNFNDEQLKSRLLKFRENNRVFPVILKGVANITNNSSFSLVIEEAVKKSLEENGIQVKTKSDFEKVINQIKENPLNIDWDKNIQENPELRMYAKNTKNLLSLLENYDKKVLLILEDMSSKTRIHFSHEKIEDWLIQIIQELKEQKIAKHLIIYWDEFTSVLELQNSGILLAKLQDIAELSEKHGIFLYVVSHRRPQQARIDQEDMEHILGRFEQLDYSMEPITTYHIIGAAIQKKNMGLWRELCSKNYPKIESIVKRISGDEGSSVIEIIKELFPIHPYTAYLATFISRYIGSTERSIFNFLHNEDSGFKKFIANNPTVEKGIYLTSNYLFDFFITEFEKKADQRFSSVLDKYILHKKTVEEKENNFIGIFKGVLLLNILYKVISVGELKFSFVAPNIDNIKGIFIGTEFEQFVDNCLDFLNESQIISRNPDNLFLVENTILPHRDIEQEKENIRGRYDTIDKILSDKQKDELNSNVTSLIIRNNEFIILDACLQEHLLKNKLSKIFKNAFSLHILAFIAKQPQDIVKVKKVITNIITENLFQNIIFIVFDDILSQEIIEKFLYYNASAIVANRHNYREEQNANIRYAEKLIDQWINSEKASIIEWFIANNNENNFRSGKLFLSDLSDIVNQDLSLSIFKSGIDNLKESKRNYNVWKYSMAKASIDNFLFAPNLDYIEQRTSSAPSKFNREILKNNLGQYIVQNNLNFQHNADLDHPLIKMSQEINKKINNTNGEIFNLGYTLQFLTEPPFGLYPNMIHMATLGFLMRNYIGKLYEAGTGKPIEKEIMQDKIYYMFEYWCQNKQSSGNKLEVRLGTKEEKELISVLCEIFEFNKKESLNDTRWAIREWIKSSALFPLWVFKLADSVSETTEMAIEQIVFLVESIDRDFAQENIKEALEIINIAKTDLSLIIPKYSLCESLFINWLKQVEDISLKDKEFKEVIAFIRENMPEEIGVASWTEDKVKEVALRWQIRKPPSTFTEHKNGDVITIIFTPATEEKKEDIISKIKNYSGDIKKLLIKITEENDVFLNILTKYLDK